MTATATVTIEAVPDTRKLRIMAEELLAAADRIDERIAALDDDA